MLAEVANAPVTDGLSMMEQMRIKLSSWFSDAAENNQLPKPEMTADGAVVVDVGPDSMVFQAIRDAAKAV
jgi:hypothetical protein